MSFAGSQGAITTNSRGATFTGRQVETGGFGSREKSDYAQELREQRQRLFEERLKRQLGLDFDDPLPDPDPPQDDQGDDDEEEQEGEEGEGEEEMTEEENEEIKKAKDDLADAIVDSLPDMPADVQGQLMGDFQRINYIQMLSHYQDLLDQDFYYSALEEYGIVPDDPQSPIIDANAAIAEINDNMLSNMNEFFDGLGKAGIEGVEEIGESASDLARAIVDRDPTFVAEAALEAMGVEFNEDGELDLKATVEDNARPIFQKMMKRYVLQPAIKYVRGALGFSAEEAVALEEQAEATLAETEFSMASELEAIAETEVNPIIGIAIGGAQAVGALSKAIAGVVNAYNLQHDAYTRGNHKWFDEGNKYKWVRSIPLIGEMADGIASLVEETKDAIAYRKGQTDRQRYDRANNAYQAKRIEMQALLEGVADGTVDINKLARGETVSFKIHFGSPLGSIRVRKKFGDLKMDNMDSLLQNTQEQTAEDVVSELENLKTEVDAEVDRLEAKGYDRVGSRLYFGNQSFDPQADQEEFSTYRFLKGQQREIDSALAEYREQLKQFR